MSLTFLRKDDLAHGAVEETAPGVRRILCNNPSAFTFRGTNTWIIGRGRVAVLDPGPEDATHLAAILAALKGEEITHILVSHTHRDHSPGARALQAATGAPSFGFGRHMTPPDQGGEGGDHGFTPDVAVPDGGTIEGDDWRLTALHTPGHCGNHLCFAMDGAAGNFFSADMVMSWSTSVVSPPDGDMGLYMRSLERIRARRYDALFPAHGPPIRRVDSFLAAYIVHRRHREKQILIALETNGAATVRQLVSRLYADHDKRLHPAACHSVLAHLLDLYRRGVVDVAGDIGIGGVWRPTFMRHAA